MMILCYVFLKICVLPYLRLKSHLSSHVAQFPPLSLYRKTVLSEDDFEDFNDQCLRFCCSSSELCRCEAQGPFCLAGHELIPIRGYDPSSVAVVCVCVCACVPVCACTSLCLWLNSFLPTSQDVGSASTCVSQLSQFLSGRLFSSRPPWC